MNTKINNSLINQVREWLDKEGIDFFRSVRDKYGEINAIWVEDGIPHVVHFREGMQVRNKLRELTAYAWTAHEYDDLWIEVINRAIE